MINNKEEDSENPDTLSNLHGNTLLIYWYMLRNTRPHGLREIQRGIGLSSSSLALHHLNKLTDHGLVGKNKHGSYIIKKRIKPGLLRFFVGSGKMLIPRFMFYAIFSTGLLISCLIFFSSVLNAMSVVLFLTLFIFTLIFWVETFRMWQSQPL